MKIYVVTSGEYSGYGIDMVTTNREVAENYIKIHAGTWHGIDDFNIEEYEDYTESLVDDLHERELVYYFYAQSGYEIKKYSRKFYELKSYSTRIRKTQSYSRVQCYEIYVHCDDEEKALKIARDMFAKAEAERLGL